MDAFLGALEESFVPAVNYFRPPNPLYIYTLRRGGIKVLQQRGLELSKNSAFSASNSTKNILNERPNFRLICCIKNPQIHPFERSGSCESVKKRA